MLKKILILYSLFGKFSTKNPTEGRFESGGFATKIDGYTIWRLFVRRVEGNYECRGMYVLYLITRRIWICGGRGWKPKLRGYLIISCPTPLPRENNKL